MKLAEAFALHEGAVVSEGSADTQTMDPELQSFYSELWNRLHGCEGMVECYIFLFKLLIEAAQGSQQWLAPYVDDPEIAYLGDWKYNTIESKSGVLFSLSEAGEEHFADWIADEAAAWAARLKRQLGPATDQELEQMRVQKRHEIFARLLGSMKTVADSILGSMRLKLKVDSRTEVRLFLFEDYDSLHGKRAFEKPDTRDSEPRPFAEVEGQAIFFFNAVPRIFYFWKPREVALDLRDPQSGEKTIALAQSLFGDARRKYFKTSLNWSWVYRVKDTTATGFLVWSVKSGGHGIGRADDVEPPYFLWKYCGPREFAHIGLIIGLDASRQLDAGKDWKTEPRWDLAWKSEILIVGNEVYVAVNLPRADSLVQAKSGKLAPIILSVFQFLYFRRVHPDQKKVLKSKQSPKNRPGPSDGVDLDGDVGISLPIRLNVTGAYQFFKDTKKKRPVLKNKGGGLFKERAARKNAGSVMKRLPEHLSPDSKIDVAKLYGTNKYSLSASSLMHAIMGRKGAAFNEWSLNKQAAFTKVPTDQEWCHLKGHGDGGDERVGNFVSGSYHCNTEQLAIESAQRKVTQAANESLYVLKSSAYLWQDDSMKASESYLKMLDKNYEAMAYGLNVPPAPDKQDGDATQLAKKEKRKKFTKDKAADLERAANAAPIAAFIRYKVYKGAGAKVFDYVFEGQSEFFDRNQYLIVNATVSALLRHHEDADLTAFVKWYEDGIKELAAKAAEDKRDDQAAGKESKSDGPSNSKDKAERERTARILQLKKPS